MYTVRKAPAWRNYWGTMPLPDGAEALGIVAGPDREGALLRLASGIYVQGNAGGIRTLPQSEIEAAVARMDAAGTLGKLGGRSTSDAKRAAARANGRLGGRPRKQRD